MSEPRDEELSRIYRDAEGPRPPQRVDDNILAASQRVAGLAPRPAGFGFARRWGAPAAIAATVLVTSTLTLMMFERKSDPEATAPRVPRAGRPAKVSPPAPAPAPARTEPEKPSPAAPAKTDPPEKSSAAAPAKAGQPEKPSPPAPARADRLEKSQPAVLPPIAPVRAPPIPQMEVRMDRAQQAAAKGAASGERPGTGQQTPQTPVAEAPRGFDVQQRMRPMQPPPAAPAPSALSTAAIGNRPAVAEAGDRTPEKWLEDIRKLKTEGRTTEVEREIAEFKKRYPDYILPDDLR
jgi:hypothetical protein